MKGLTDDELALLEHTRAFAREHLDSGRSPLLAGKALLPLAADIGLLGLQVPHALGGRGVSFQCKARVAEVLAAADFGVAMALINTHNVAEHLSRLASAEVAKHWVPRLVAGQLSACTALTEPGAGSDVSAIQTRAVAVPGGWELTGSKAWIINAMHTDLVIVYAQTQVGAGTAGIAAFVVDSAQPGFERLTTSESSPMPSLGTGDFRLTNYRCSSAHMLSPPGEAFKDIMQGINGARVYVAAMCCGMVDKALQVASAYGNSRQTFGKPLLGHQSWRWQLANAAVELEAARLLTYQAASTIDEGKSVQIAAAKAKVFATQIAQKYVSTLMHAMGAEGLKAQYPFAQHLLAAQIAGLVDGSTEMLLEQIAREFRN